MSEQFTIDGRRILDEKTVGGELQQLVEMAAKPPVWICSCGKAGCEHLQRIRPAVAKANLRPPLWLVLLATIALVLICAYIVS
jgi:hypothetical protein